MARPRVPRGTPRLPVRGVSPDTIGAVKWYVKASRVAMEMVRDRRPPQPLGWRQSARLLRRGFVPRAYATYGLDRNDPAQFLSHRERERTWVLNWPMSGLIDDKLASAFMVEHLGARTPRPWGLVLQGRVHALDGSPPAEVLDALRAELARVGRLVVKPNFGGGGTGVFVLEHADGGVRLNGVETTWPDAEAWLATISEYLVSEFVQQAAYAREIFPGAANTIRMLVIHDDDGPFVATAVHRFGRASSGPVDNWSRGGVSARVDVASGRLGRAVRHGSSGELLWHDDHPDTGAPITGVAVDHWEDVVEGVLAFARRARFLPYVGWDVIVTDDGFRILEGNKFSDVNMLQAHGPLLEHPRARRFYERQGILDGSASPASGLDDDGAVPSTSPEAAEARAPRPRRRRLAPRRGTRVG